MRRRKKENIVYSSQSFSLFFFFFSSWGWQRMDWCDVVMWLFFLRLGFCLSRYNQIEIWGQEIWGGNGFFFFLFLYLTRDGPFTAAQGRYFPAYYGAHKKKKWVGDKELGDVGDEMGKWWSYPFSEQKEVSSIAQILGVDGNDECFEQLMMVNNVWFLWSVWCAILDVTLGYCILDGSMTCCSRICSISIISIIFSAGVGRYEILLSCLYHPYTLSRYNNF